MRAVARIAEALVGNTGYAVWLVTGGGIAGAEAGALGAAGLRLGAKIRQFLRY